MVLVAEAVAITVLLVVVQQLVLSQIVVVQGCGEEGRLTLLDRHVGDERSIFVLEVPRSPTGDPVLV